MPSNIPEEFQIIDAHKLLDIAYNTAARDARRPVAVFNEKMRDIIYQAMDEARVSFYVKTNSRSHLPHFFKLTDVQDFIAKAQRELREIDLQKSVDRAKTIVDSAFKSVPAFDMRASDYIEIRGTSILPKQSLQIPESETLDEPVRRCSHRSLKHYPAPLKRREKPRHRPDNGPYHK